MNLSSLLPRRPTCALLGAAALAITIAPGVQAGTETEAKVVTPPPVQSLVHGLLNLEVSNAYITPRGLLVENQGVVFQPLLLLFWNLYHNENAFLNDVTLTTGVWNSWHTRKSGATPREWNEIDPISGLTFKFAKDWQLDVFYTAFVSQTNSYDTSTNLDVKLSFNDQAYLGAFSLHPYVEYFQEIQNKATVVLNPATSNESFYFQLGIDPGYQFKNGIKVEFPTYVSIVDGDFYQRFDGTGGGSGVGVFSSQVKVSAPLTFIPKGYGSWTGYVGFQYYHLNNPGVLDGNQVLGASAEREKDLYQVHAGISIFF